MPYDKNSELPDWVKKAFPEDIQTAYRKAYNAALTTYKDDEGKAAAVAISAVQKMGYVKKGDNWVKAEYVKDLGLKPGEFLHPNEPDKKLVITEQNLKDYVANTQKIIDAGGTIPITISHPKDEREKIENNEGEILGVWYDSEEQLPYMAFKPSTLVKGWIDEGKLKAVSPGIYHDVVTSIGKLPSMIDHVALTNSPFNIQQSGFMPVTAEKFGKAVLFFENSYVSQEQNDNGLLTMMQAIYEKIIGKNQTSQKGEDKMGELTLEQAKNKIAELEAQKQKDVAERDKTILDLQKKNEEYEKAETKRKEDARKLAFEQVNKKVDKLIEDKKVEPKNREKLVADFTVLYDNEIADAEKYIFERFESAEPKKNKLKQTEIIIEKETVDINTDEGQDKLHNVILARARDMKAKDPEGKKHTENFYFESAQKTVYAELGIGESE